MYAPPGIADFHLQKLKSLATSTLKRQFSADRF